jgi:hypothetical protein
MKKKILISSVVITLVVVIMLFTKGWLGTTGAPATWHTITSFSGTGQKTTSSFYVPGEKWRITWTATHEETYPHISALFTFFVYPSKQTTLFPVAEDTVVESIWDGTTKTETQYVNKGKQSFYLVVATGQAISWTLKIESYH